MTPNWEGDGLSSCPLPLNAIDPWVSINAHGEQARRLPDGGIGAGAISYGQRWKRLNETKVNPADAY